MWSSGKCRTRLLLLLVGVLLSGTGALAVVYAEFRAQAFRPADATDDFVSGEARDPDGDGLVNFFEHTLGLDPTRPDSERAFVWQRMPNGVALEFPSAAAPQDTIIEALWSSDLTGTTWLPLSSTVLDSGAAGSTLAAQLPFPTGSPRAFLRLAATQVAPPPAEVRWVWFEAESAGGETGAELSNGAMTWVGPGGHVQRSVVVPSAGTYQLWVRKFWNPQAFRWRVGAADAWKDSPAQTLSDLVLLAGNPGRRVGWANVGAVSLLPGTHTFRLEVPAADPNTTAYDCFLLTRDPFTPRGKFKPDEVFQVTQPGWFAFQPVPDPYGFSPIDLRYLNERQAGDHGFVRVEGEDFVQGQTGEPVRFWAVNVGMGFVGNASTELDAFARAMAKRGVNLVRVHGPIYDDSGTGFGAVDTHRVAKLHYFIKALKREGIYTSLSIYFPLWVTLGPENPQFPGYQDKHPFALLYFNESFQQVFREWWRYLLTTPNPHTGLAIKDDPAVAFAEMYNEDSTLFWTFNPEAGAAGNLPDAQRALIEKQFGDWLLGRYPGRSLAQIKSGEWNGLGTAQDDFANGRVGFRGLWNIANDRTRRDQDTARFLTELMLAFHRDTYDYLKQELGFRGLVYCSNWKTASPQYLDPLDKYANAAGDFFDRHGYLGGLHQGPNAAWNIEPNQTYDDRSALRFRSADGSGEDFSNPLWDIIYQGRPSTVSEINWPLPNRYRADMILAGAAYGALQGSDAIIWFAAGSPAWEGLPGKFSIQTPVVLGQFPAAALIYRQGLVRTAPHVVEIQLAVSDLYELKGTPMPAPQNFDQLRGDDLPPGGTITNVSAIDSLAFLVGRVGVDFVTNAAPESRILDLSPYLDRARKQVRSHSGELEWDWGTGRFTINAPAAQGVSGFLSALGPVELDGVRIQSAMDYGAVVLVAMDAQPIASSGKMLLQVASEEIPLGWATSAPSGVRTITDRGTVPLLVKNLGGTVQLKRADAAALTVTPLDFNGYRLSGPPMAAADFVLRPDAPYYLIEE